MHLAVEEAQPDSSGPARHQAAEARCKVGSSSCAVNCALTLQLNQFVQLLPYSSVSDGL